MGGWWLPFVGLALFSLALSACGVSPQAFPNGTTRRAGPVEVALFLEPNPPRVGQEATLAFEIRRAGRPVAEEEATCQLKLDMPKMPMGLPMVPLTFGSPGEVRFRYAFPMAGEWQAVLRVTLADGSGGEAEFNFDVGP